MLSERISNRMGNRFEMIRLWIQLILVNTCNVWICLINYVCISNCVCVLCMTWMNVEAFVSIFFVPFHFIPFNVPFAIGHFCMCVCTISICSHSKYNLVIKYARNSRVEIAISHWFVRTHIHTFGKENTQI